MEIFFLPPIYLLMLLAAGVITGMTFDYIVQKPFVMASATLFFIFTVSQLIFRVLLNEEPARLVGQAVYFFLFLGIIYVTRIVKNHWLVDKR